MIIETLASSPASLRAAPNDTVATTLRDVSVGQALPEVGVTAVNIIPCGHKIALEALAPGDAIRKFGDIIGYARQPIRAGEWVHSHNLERHRSEAVLPGECAQPPRAQYPKIDAGFRGYRRPDGRVGTRNEVWIIATVGCTTRTAERIAQYARSEAAGKIDGVHAITHPFGCSQLGDDLVGTEAILAGLACNPNAGGVLFVGLDANDQACSDLLQQIPKTRRDRVRILAAQEVDDEVLEGLSIVGELISLMEDDHREYCASSDLVVGLKCGVSDAFTSLSSNPLLGRIGDRVCWAGGSVILTEISKLGGAAHALVSRGANPSVERAIEQSLTRRDPCNENLGTPSSSTRLQYGITTPEERSLGALRKAGSTPINAVFSYAQSVPPNAGLVLLDAPENDSMSTTALAAAGANLILFSTGRGTPLGCPVPTIKVSSNSSLAKRKPTWIDFDAGTALKSAGPAMLEKRFFDDILRTASGRRTRNEMLDERQISIWIPGMAG